MNEVELDGKRTLIVTTKDLVESAKDNARLSALQDKIEKFRADGTNQVYLITSRERGGIPPFLQGLVAYQKNCFFLRGESTAPQTKSVENGVDSVNGWLEKSYEAMHFHTKNGDLRMNEKNTVKYGGSQDKYLEYQKNINISKSNFNGHVNREGMIKKKI